MVWRLILGGAAGLLIGAVVGTIAKSRGGTCPLTCNPYAAAGFGALFGAVIAATFGSSGPAPGLDKIPAVAGRADFERLVLRASRPVLVDFYETNCAPCRRLGPVLGKLAGEYAGRADFVKINVAEAPELAQPYDLRGVPTVLLFAGGREARRLVGLRSVDDYRAALDAVIRDHPQPREEPPMTERTDVVTFKGNPLTLAGRAVNVGDAAPDFAALANDLSEVRLSSFRGKVCVVTTVPSLDTPVCDRETRRFNEEAGRLGEKVVVLTVSMDLPFAQARWCGAAGIEHVRTLSDHRDAAAGQGLGVLVRELRLLARAVFVLDAEGVVRYVQIVPEMTNEPDYDAALAAVRKLTQP